MVDLQQLRARAISQSLFRPATLKAAISRLGFVQADPIRSPARAQDLILRHRVKDYRVGDLDRSYCSLGIEEDYLYAYGYLSRRVWELVHPRVTVRLPTLDQRVLDAVRRLGPTHPSGLESEFGRKRVVNAWGGYSQATKRALERLHYHGHLRIARREKGIRVYEPMLLPVEPMPPLERLRKLVVVVANLLAPIPERTLQAIASRLRRFIPGSADHRTAIRGLFRSGELEKAIVDKIIYVWPPSRVVREEPTRRVSFLAPFDPLVWDRLRFEHFWQWPYRFEAYTPPAKRLRGYYAMPVLWGDRVIGWANAEVRGQSLNVQLGFVGKRPDDHEFSREVDAELARLEEFLRSRPSTARRP
ncbi:MAG: DNA glycosylase AlkZ-like family protein [Terriglobia bacterium]